MIGIIEDSFNEGLNPDDYHIKKIKEHEQQLENGNNDIDVLVNLELLLSDALVMYGHHLLWGKVDQSKLRKDWDVPKSPKPAGLDTLFTQYKYNDDLKGFFDRIKPRKEMYIGLKKELKDYREIAAAGGWPIIPDGKVLKPGMTDERVPVIKKYLSITGDYKNSADDNTSTVYDDDLVAAVEKFQFRHNLTTDGIIGKGTLEQMNVPVEKRIDMIRVNLERSRWVMHGLPDDFLVVNIAGFNVRRIQNGSITYFSPVIVGKLHHESPIFKGKMIYAEINPTWTVPYSIASTETLSKLKKNPNYLKEKNMVIMDRSGKILDPSKIDFSEYSRNNFPFTVRQEPGPNNALGQVKFIFPNKYSVYLHDTPARTLFSRQDRAFSHGCIRLEKKWELLMNLMDDPEVWNMDKINEILASKKTTRVNLPYPEDIVILYWTAGYSKENDALFFNKDVYQRDNPVLEALDGPVTL
jgi:murein L,D-transpeptidase YcbB/YkuD